MKELNIMEAKELAIHFFSSTWPKEWEIQINNDLTYTLEEGYIFCWHVKRNGILTRITCNYPIGVNKKTGIIFYIFTKRISSKKDLYEAFRKKIIDPTYTYEDDTKKLGNEPSFGVIKDA